MDLFSRHDLNTLIGQPRSNCVSLYLPTHPAAGERDAVGLADLVRDAEAGLVSRGLRRSDADDILAPACRLREDEEFWRQRGDGLAVFLRAGWWSACRSRSRNWSWSPTTSTCSR